MESALRISGDRRIISYENGEVTVRTMTFFEPQIAGLMDLRRRFPRSMRVILEGYAHLARMIDKCRAVLAGTEGEYVYPCPMDDRL